MTRDTQPAQLLPGLLMQYGDEEEWFYEELRDCHRGASATPLRAP